MEVLVAGGTGFIGSTLCETLLERGHDVTALARSPDADGLAPGVATTRGDVTDPESIAGPVAAHDAVVNLVAPSPLYQQGRSAHDRIHRGGTRTLVEAATAADVDRFVQVSVLGADPDGPTAGLRAKGRAEAIVREADVPATIVRPSIVFGDGDEIRHFTRLVTTPYVTVLPGGGTVPFQPIWVGDLAPILAATVESREHVGETYEIGGPAVLTLADITRAVHAAAGRRVRVLPVPMALVHLAFALADPIPPIPFGRDQARALTVDNTVTSNDVSAFGRDPSSLRTLEDYLGLD